MNDLSGKCVNVVLAVEMGRGMEFLEYPVKIVATFNGRTLESDLIEQDECPKFNTELVWETEKKEVRRARSSNTPVRVEVQVVDKNHRRDRIGFVLLSPRCANIIPSGTKLEIPFKWLKLLGVVPEHKNSHPELYLSLTIRDLTINILSDEPLAVDINSEEESEDHSEGDSEVFPIKYLPDGFIQVGTDDTCNDTFLLSIVLQVAYNLDLLLPEVLVFNQNREKYYISFRILGITIKSKPFCRDLHANIPMNEKIVVRIRSEYETLRAYLTEHCQILVCFYCGRDKLGMTKLVLNTLLQSTVEEEFLIKEDSAMCEQKCYFKYPSQHGIVPSGPGNRQPYVEVSTTVKRTEIRPISAKSVSSEASAESIVIQSTVSEEEEEKAESPRSLKKIDEEVNNQLEEDEMSSSDKQTPSPRNLNIGCGDARGMLQKTSVASPAVSACGDQNDQSIALELQVLELPLDNVEVHVPETGRLTERLLRNAPPLPSPDSNIKPEDISRKINMYQQYCLDVILEKITLKRHVRAKKLCFKFKHPKAASVTVVVSEMHTEDNCIGEDIFLETARCKMYFISSTEHIRKMVYAWPPKLILADENDQVLTEELDIYTAMFLGKQRTDCSYITEFKAIRTFEPLAKINITMYLQEYGLADLPNPTNYDLLPPILDEEISIKELQELQEWKEIQRIQFLADLKIVEKQRMIKLQKHWAKRKRELEEKLSKSIIRCRNLSQELQGAVNSIRTKKALELKESELNSKPNCSFQDNVQQNFQKYSQCEKRELIETISKMQRDNDHLKEIIKDFRQEIMQIKKTALTKEQTTNLLQQLRGLEEKFEDAQKAKGYFKEQWKKAVKEIHDLKSEEQKLIQEKIQSQKSELSQLSLENFSSSDIGSAAYDYDRDKFSVPVHTSSHFENFKWSNVDFPLGK